MFMYPPLTPENMKLFFPSSEKPLSDKEITDFLTSEPLVNERYEQIEHAKKWYRYFKYDTATKKYNTKKEIKQDIKALDERLNWWMIYKRTAPNEMTRVYCDLHIEDYDREKERLKKRLMYTGVKFDNNNLVKARQVPISDFLEFNSAGMAKCPFHTEKTASFHLIKGKNKGFCFGGCGVKDTIEVVQQINNCNFKSALKIILRK